jgi:hypothetical protein
VNIIQKAEEAKQAVPYVTFHLRQSDDSTVAFEKDVLAKVPQWKKDAFAWSVALAVASVVSSVLIWLSGGGLGIPGWLALLGFTVAQIVAYEIAGDPTEDYTTIATPPKIVVPEVDSIPEGTPKEMAVSALDFLSYLNATGTSLIRYSAASSAGQAQFMRSQIETAAKYMQLARSRFDTFTQLMSKAVLDVPVPSASQITTFKDYLRTQGLPPYADKVIQSLGLGQYAKSITTYLSDAAEDDFMIPLGQVLKPTDDNMNALAHSIDLIMAAEKTANPLSQWPLYLSVAVAIVLAVVAVYAIRRRRLARRPGAEKPERSISSSYPRSFCSHCGAEIASESKGDYCIECGKSISRW